MVYEADAAGTLIEIVAGEGDTLPIGEVIARVGEAGEAPAGGNGGAPKQKPDEKTEPEEKPKREEPEQATADRRRAKGGGRTGAGGDLGRRAGQGIPDRPANRRREGPGPLGVAGLRARRPDRQGRRREGGPR